VDFFELDFFFNNSTVFSNNDHDRKLLFCHSQNCHRKSFEVCGKKFLDFSKNSSKKATHFYFWYDVGTVDDLIISKSRIKLFDLHRL